LVAFWLGRSARHSGLEASHFLPMTGDGHVRGGQERSELRLGQHVALEAQDEPPKLRTIGHWRPD